MQRKKGFIAYYRRRPLTHLEKIDEIWLDVVREAIVAEVHSCNRAYDYFRGYTHYQSLPRQWGHPSG